MLLRLSEACIIVGLNSNKRANRDKTPGVNVSNKCGENRFTKICSIISNNAFFNKELYVDLDLVKPQPKIVTNNGAANPPKPAIV